MLPNVRPLSLWPPAAKLGLVAALALALCACAATQPPRGAANARGTGHYYLPALPALDPDSEAWRQEPPFSEQELAGFVRDLHNIKTMNPQDTENYLLRDRGWTSARLQYMDAKVARLVMAIDAENLESLSAAGPDYLPPSREEIYAVQKYYPVLSNMLKARAQTDN